MKGTEGRNLLSMERQFPCCPCSHPPPIPVTEIREWQLEAFIDPQSSQRLLMDPDTNMVYLMDKTERWPLVFGLLDDDGETVKRGFAPILQEFISRWGRV